MLKKNQSTTVFIREPVKKYSLKKSRDPEKEKPKKIKGIHMFLSVVTVAILLGLIGIGIVALYYPETRQFLFNALKDAVNIYTSTESL